MTHLYIELNTGLTEEVNSSIISKLYELAISGDLDETSDLKGRLHSTSAKEDHITYFSTHYPDLYVSADKQYISFADPEIERLLTAKVGDGVGITLLDMTPVTDLNWSYNFQGNNSIQTFDELNRFPTIKSLGTYCFNFARNLTSIGLNNIEYIGGEAFRATKLTGIINLPSVKQIGDNDRGRSFGNCEYITEVNIGSNFLSFVGGYSFVECINLQKITMAAKCPDIKDSTFSECRSLSVFDADMSDVEDIYSNAFYNCVNLTSLDLSNVKYLGYLAFRKSGLTGVIDLTSLIGFRASNGTLGQKGGNWTFDSCTGITEVKFSQQNLQYFDVSGIFVGCSNLTKVSGLSNITYIPPSTFKECTSLTNVDIDWTKITEICTQSFLKCPILLTLDLTNVTVGEQAFDGTTNVVITNFPRMTEYGFRQFQNIKGLISVTIPKEVLTCGNYTFAYCSNLQSISFETGFQLTTLPYGMFSVCTSLQSVTIPEGITTIGQQCFSECSSLTYVDLPSTITTMGENPFLFSNNLTTLICRAVTPPTWSGNNRTMPNINIYVPDASVSAYQSAANWSTYSSKIKGISQLPNS